jgi:folate-binding protein YgfZ
MPEIAAEVEQVELDGQYRVLREAAGVVARGSRATVRVAGQDAVEYLHGQITNDIEALGDGEGCYAALLDRKGHIRADMRVLRLGEDELLLDLEQLALPAALHHLRTYSIGRQVEIEDGTGERAVLSVIGPGALEMTGAGPLSPEHTHREIELGGAGCLAVATDLGVDLITPAARADAVRVSLDASGIVEVSEAAAEILRVESGRPRFGAEIGETAMPAEAGIEERAVSFTKGCYIGQETVARLHYKGRPNRHLRGLRLERPAAAGEPIRAGERELGSVGTACLSPALGPIALAIVRREAEPGASVTVGEDGTGAEVVELPFA